MPSTLTKTIKPTGQGGDYTTRGALLVGEVTDLQVADIILHAQPAGDWTGVTDTVDQAFDDTDGWNSDETHYILFQPDAANLATWTWDEDKYVVRVDGADGVINNLMARLVVRGVQVHSDNAFRACIDSRLAGGHTTIDGCFCRALNQTQNAAVISFGSVALTCEVINSWLVGGGDGIRSAGVTARDMFIANNTLDDMSQRALNIQFSTGTITAYNNVAQRTTLDNYVLAVSGGSLVTGRNLGDDASSPDAAFRNKTVLFTDDDGFDFSLTAADTEATGQGLDLEGDPTYSFNNAGGGRTRIAVWDLGAYQLVRIENPGIEIEVGTTLGIGGGVTGTGGPTTAGLVKLEVLDSNRDLDTTLIAEGALVLADDEDKSWGNLSGPSVTHTFDTAGLFFVLGTTTDDVGEARTIECAVRVGPITSLVTDLRAQTGGSDQGNITVGATVTVVGGLTARNRDLAGMEVKLELLDSSKSLVTTLITQATEAFTEDTERTWANLKGSAVTFTAGAAALYYLRATVTDAEGNAFTDGDVPFETAVGVTTPTRPVIGSITNVGTAVTVPLTSVGANQARGWLYDSDGTEIDQSADITGDGNLSLTLDSLDKIVMVVAQTFDGDGCFSEADVRWLFFSSDATANEILAAVIDTLQANATLVALLNSSADIRRGFQPNARAFAEITLSVLDDPDLALDDTDDSRDITLEVNVWDYTQDGATVIQQQIDNTLHDNRGIDTTNWAVQSSRRTGSFGPSPTGIENSSTGKSLWQLQMTFVMKARKK